MQILPLIISAHFVVVFEILGFCSMIFLKFSVNLDLEKFTKFKYFTYVIGYCQGTLRSCKSCLQI